MDRLVNASREGLAASQSGTVLYVLVYCIVYVYDLLSVVLVLFFGMMTMQSDVY